MLQIDLFTSSSARDAEGNPLTKAIVSNATGDLTETSVLQQVSEWLSSPDKHVLVLAESAEIRRHA